MSTKSRDIWDIADRSGRPSPEGSSLEPTWSLTHLPAISAESALGGGVLAGFRDCSWSPWWRPLSSALPEGDARRAASVPCPPRRRPLDVESSGAARRLPLTGWTPPPRSPARDPAKVWAPSSRLCADICPEGTSGRGFRVVFLIGSWRFRPLSPREPGRQDLVLPLAVVADTSSFQWGQLGFLTIRWDVRKRLHFWPVLSIQ